MDSVVERDEDSLEGLRKGQSLRKVMSNVRLKSETASTKTATEYRGLRTVDILPLYPIIMGDVGCDVNEVENTACEEDEGLRSRRYHIARVR